MEIENDIEMYLKNSIRAAGGKCMKFVSPGTRGVPDRICFLKGLCFFVELKSKSGKLSAAQKVAISEFRKQGQHVYVMASRDDIAHLVGLISEYGVLPSESRYQKV